MTQPSLPAESPSSATALLREFESTWKIVAEGPPRVEDYLARLPDTERPAAQRALEQIARRFRSRLDSRQSGDPYQTVDPSPATTDGVFASPDESQSIAPNHTVDHWPATEGSAEPPVSATVDESKGVLVGSGTVDEASGKPIGVPEQKKAGRPTVPGYLIQGELGRGGMGVVYKAHHVKLDRVVALKMILGGAHVDEMQLTRFYTEAQAVARLQHPGIVQVFEIDEHDGLPYFSLEFVNGGSLAKKINRTPQPPKESAALLEQIARAVQAAHEKGIIHRDLKPANVLLTKDGKPKVTDFGLARRLEGDAGQTQSGTVLGTPNYMAPEQARGDVENVGALADVYSLGAILYEMLTGRPPFQGTTVLETLGQVESKEPVPPAQLSPAVPKDLDTICLKCLQKEPAKRYASAGELADDLRRFLEGRPITARPVSRTERLWRLCKRNKVVSSLTAAVAVLVLAGLIGGPLAALEYRGQRDTAEQAKEMAENSEKLERIAHGKTAEAEKKERIAHGKTEQARVLEGKARVEADNDVESSLFALRAFLTQIADLCKGRPDLLPIRTEMTRRALIQIDHLAGSVTKRSVTMRTTGVAHVRIGDLYLETGLPSKAKTHYDRAFAIFDEVWKAAPDDPTNVRNLASVYAKRGDVLVALGDDRGGKASYEQALSLRKQWRAMMLDEATGKTAVPKDQDRPAATMANVAEADYSMMETYSAIGNVLFKMGDPKAARSYYLLTKKAYDELPAVRRNAVPRNEVASTQQRLGQTALQSGDVEQAREDLQAACKLREDEVRVRMAQKDKTGLPTFRRELALSRIDLGDLDLFHDGDAASAAKYYERATAGLEMLTREYPKNVIYAQDLAYADYRLGYASQKAALFKKGPASAVWIAASQFAFNRSRRTLLTVADLDKADVGVQFQIMLAEARCGLRSQAAARADSLASKYPNAPRVQFQAACCYALLVPLGDAAQAKDYADKAVKALEQAASRGWKDVEALRHDPDLDPVRDDPRLAALARKILDAEKKK